MLECRGLAVRYGQHEALHGVALGVAPGEIVVILGANGAGKSTLLQAIAGLVPSSGEIRLDGRSIAGFPPHLIVEAGLALVPEGRRIFGELSVHENLLLGAYARRARPTEREHLDRVLALFPRLAERRRQVARTMSGGEQQMVAIGRAMMSAPVILMLDEPSLGLSPILCTELFRALAQIRKTGAGILLVEQNAQQALAIADRGYLLENGRIVGEGTAQSLAEDPAVQRAYLGGAAAVAAPPLPPALAPAIPPAALSSPAATIAAEQLIRGSIDELTRRAAAIQSEHLLASRPQRSETPPAPITRRAGADTALQEAIAEIEAAAARARQ
jgi:branched-chain amino acid transport system ATP-binding protein